MGLKDWIPFVARNVEPVILTDEPDFASIPSFEEVDNESFEIPIEIIEDVINAMIATDNFAPDICFWHPRAFIYGKNAIKETRLTVAYVVFPDELAFGISYCSIHDQFSKTAGREIAQERLSSDDCISVPLARPITNSEAREIIESFIGMGHLIGLPHYPESKHGILLDV